MNDNDFACRRNQQIHEAAVLLAEDESPYHLARQLVVARDRIVALEMALFERQHRAIEAEHGADPMGDRY